MELQMQIGDVQILNGMAKKNKRKISGCEFIRAVVMCTK